MTTTTRYQGYKQVIDPALLAYPDLLVEEQTHTNGATTTYVELRHGRSGFAVCLRAEDGVDRQVDWFNPNIHGFYAEGAAVDYAERGGTKADALSAARTQIADDVENNFTRVPNSDTAAFPELIIEEQTHTNGATTSYVELRRGGFGYLVILRTVDWTASEIEWHNGRRHSESEEYALLEDYASRGGDRAAAASALDRMRQVAPIVNCALCGLKRRETELYVTSLSLSQIYGSLVELNSRDDEPFPAVYQVVCSDCLNEQGPLDLDAQFDPGELKLERAAVAALRTGGDPVRYWGFVVVPGSKGRAILHYHGQSNWGVVRLSLSGFGGATTDAALLDWLTRPAARPTEEYRVTETPRFFDPATPDGRFGLAQALTAAREGQESVSLEALSRI